MARRVWLHIGCPKTGTAYLQGLVWSNRASLRRQGLLLPGTSRQDHYQASLYVRGAHAKRARAKAIESTWEDLVDAVRSTDDDVLISHELFAMCNAKQARFTLDALGGAETHVVITARDLARQIPASWQQGIKHGSSEHLHEFVRDVIDRGPRARAFWKMQDLPELTARWAATLPGSRLHLVTVPPKGADPTVLWTRFASLLGVEPDSVSQESTRSNESLGRVEVELLRRINERKDDRFPSADAHLWFRDLLANDTLAKRAGKEKFALDRDVHEWILKTSQETVSALKERDYDVVGDLTDLIPPDEPERGADPARATDQELLTASIETILDLLAVHRETVRAQRQWSQRLPEAAQRRLPKAARKALRRLR